MDAPYIMRCKKCNDRVYIHSNEEWRDFNKSELCYECNKEVKE